MEALQKNILIEKGENINPDELQAGITKIKELPGIKNISLENGKLSIQYNPYFISKTYLGEQLEELGFMLFKKSKKGFWARSIDKLAKNNKKTFGNQRLDCCNIK